MDIKHMSNQEFAKFLCENLNGPTGRRMYTFYDNFNAEDTELSEAFMVTEVGFCGRTTTIANMTGGGFPFVYEHAKYDRGDKQFIAAFVQYLEGSHFDAGVWVDLLYEGSPKFPVKKADRMNANLFVDFVWSSCRDEDFSKITIYEQQDSNFNTPRFVLSWVSVAATKTVLCNRDVFGGSLFSHEITAQEQGSFSDSFLGYLLKNNLVNDGVVTYTITK